MTYRARIGVLRAWREDATARQKLYALYAPEVECIGKGKARKPYEFGVRASIALTPRSGLMVGARTFPGSPCDGLVLNEQLEQTAIVPEDTGKAPKQVLVDLGYRGVDKDNPTVQIIHRGNYKSLTQPQRRWLERRHAVEPAIVHLKSDNRKDRCWLQGQLGDALHAVLCATGYNLRWLMRAMVRLGLKALLLRPLFLALLRPITCTMRTDHFRQYSALWLLVALYEFCRGDYLIDTRLVAMTHAVLALPTHLSKSWRKCRRDI